MRGDQVEQAETAAAAAVPPSRPVGGFCHLVLCRFPGSGSIRQIGADNREPTVMLSPFKFVMLSHRGSRGHTEVCKDHKLPNVTTCARSAGPQRNISAFPPSAGLVRGLAAS